MKKKFLAILLAVVMAAGLLSATAFAADTDFVIEDGKLMQYTGSGGDVTIPNGVTEIGSSAFNGCTSLTSVTIPASVTSIGFEAFSSCTSLTSITIPKSVTSFGWNAFFGCTSLSRVTISNGVTEIGYQAFFGCTSLTSVTIPASVTTIYQAAFFECTNLTDVYYGGSADQWGTIQGIVVFGPADSATFANGGQAYASLDGVTVHYNSVMPTEPEEPTEHLTGSCGDNVTWSYSGGVLTIQGTGPMYDDYYLDTRPWADFSQEISTIVIGDGVTTIGILTFAFCSNLTSVIIPGSVTTIGDHAFHSCSSLTSVTIPGSVTTIGDHAFDSCSSLTSVTIPGSVTTIGEWTFFACSLTSVTIPDGVTTIGEWVFGGCESLTSVTIPVSVTSIGEFAFAAFNLADVYYGGSKDQWGQIEIDESNIPLTFAKIHYVVTPVFPDTPDWCAAEANWGAEQGIVLGIGKGLFGTYDTCTQGTIITFLWRANKEPAASAQAPVTAESFFQDAINWAYEQGIIGADFQSTAPCTRATAVKYIWQALGSKSAPASSFSDVPAGSDYAGAVNWAVANGITKGTGDGTTFSPANTCTRGEIVTFLYRAYAPDAV